MNGKFVEKAIFINPIFNKWCIPRVVES